MYILVIGTVSIFMFFCLYLSDYFQNFNSIFNILVGSMYTIRTHKFPLKYNLCENKQLPRYLPTLLHYYILYFYN